MCVYVCVCAYKKWTDWKLCIKQPGKYIKKTVELTVLNEKTKAGVIKTVQYYLKDRYIDNERKRSSRIRSINVFPDLWKYGYCIVVKERIKFLINCAESNGFLNEFVCESVGVLKNSLQMELKDNFGARFFEIHLTGIFKMFMENVHYRKAMRGFKNFS